MLRHCAAHNALCDIEGAAAVPLRICGAFPADGTQKPGSRHIVMYVGR